MKKMLRTLSVISLAVGLLSACASSTEPSEAYKNESPQQIFRLGKQALIDKSFNEATKRFEALDVQYPFGPETEQAQFYLIYAYYMKEDYLLCSSEADRFIHLYPTNPNVDYAYYMRGLADYYQNLGIFERVFGADLAKRDLIQIQKSYADFNDLLMHFPNSRYAPAAHQYMVYLRNILANHELEVAEFYYSHKAYVAAINRASNVVAHYQGAPAVVRSLEVMAQSYQKLGMTTLKNQTLSVLQYNYPNITTSQALSE